MVWSLSETSPTGPTCLFGSDGQVISGRERRGSPFRRRSLTATARMADVLSDGSRGRQQNGVTEACRVQLRHPPRQDPRRDLQISDDCFPNGNPAGRSASKSRSATAGRRPARSRTSRSCQDQETRSRSIWAIPGTARQERSTPRTSIGGAWFTSGLYQLIRLGILTPKDKAAADEELLRILKQEGMWKVRRGIWRWPGKWIMGLGLRKKERYVPCP